MQNDVYEVIEAKAMAAALGMSDHELHGLVIGCVIAFPNESVEIVAKNVFELRDEISDVEQLTELLSFSSANLDDSEMGFRLSFGHLTGVVAKADAMLFWITGLLEGLRQVDVSTYPPECEEIINALDDVLTLDTEIEETVDNERMLYEIEEFVRVSVLLLRENLK